MAPSTSTKHDQTYDLLMETENFPAGWDCETITTQLRKALEQGMDQSEAKAIYGADILAAALAPKL